jgi:hypothetical protein
MHGWFQVQIGVFLVINARLRWLNNVTGVHLVQVSLLLIGQQGLGHLFKYRPLLPNGWRIVQIYANVIGKRLIQRQPLVVQYKQQANLLLLMHNYTPLVISRNDKNMQLTLLSQRKLALTARNTRFAL